MGKVSDFGLKLKKKEDINTIFSQEQSLYANLPKAEIPCSWNPLNFA